MKTKEYLNPDDPEVAAIIADKCHRRMKSDNARLHILMTKPHRCGNGWKTWNHIAFEAIVIAESEAEQRDRDWAAAAHCKTCQYHNGGCPNNDDDGSVSYFHNCKEIEQFLKFYDNE